MASGCLQKWLDFIYESCTSELSKQLHALDPERRAGLVAVMEEMLEFIREELQSKFDFWNHLPHLLLGLFHPDLSVAKYIGHLCIAEWEKQPNKALFHRVVHRFFHGINFQQLKAFCADPLVPLRSFPELYLLVFSYNTISLVERSIEAEHSKIEEAPPVPFKACFG